MAGHIVGSLKSPPMGCTVLSDHISCYSYTHILVLLVYYRLGIWHLDLIHKIKTRLPWMVNHYPHDGYRPPQSHGWSLTIQNLPEGIVLQAWNLATRLN